MCYFIFWDVFLNPSQLSSHGMHDLIEGDLSASG